MLTFDTSFVVLEAILLSTETAMPCNIFFSNDVVWVS